jgi:hypothetical protein
VAITEQATVVVFFKKRNKERRRQLLAWQCHDMRRAFFCFLGEAMA